jgi:radical SAM superfamily enzyme YgiQ (UPF0313 family)
MPEPVFPLGLAHLSAALRRVGREAHFVDLLVEKDRFETLLKETEPDVVGISVRNIDDVLIRKQATFIESLGALVARAHQQQGCRVVLGGSGFSILPRELLELTGADFGIVGEGETALIQLLVALENGSDYRTIPSLAFWQSGKTVINAEGKVPSEFSLQAEDWPRQIAAHYLETGAMLNLQTQRGCAHRCCYCTYPVIEGARHRSCAPEAVVAGFEQLQAMGATYAFIVDAVFNSSPRHVMAVCEALARKSLKIRWGCFLRPQNLTRELMRLMVAAGLAHIEFGSDSFCDEVLDEYQKALTFDDIYHSTELARREDVNFCHFVIAGGPGETRATLERGFENSKRLGAAIIIVAPGMRIYPGTPLFKRAVAEGALKPETNLLVPAYYLAPGLSLEMVLEQLKSYSQRSANWMLGDFDPAHASLVTRLRRRGVTGPLWSYFSAAQRLWPAGQVGLGSQKKIGTAA